MEKIFSLITFLTFISFSHAWFENCNYNYSVQITSALPLTNPNYPNRYSSGSSCKYYLTAPVGYTIQLQCNYNLDTPLADCASQHLYVSRDGDRNLAYSEYFCGTSSLTRFSVGNEMSFGYTSNLNYAGSFYCQATAIATTQTNCQCGWSKTTRIVGGSNAQPNEYVSMAGLVDTTMTGSSTGPIFCGASIISEYYALTAAHCFNVYRPLSTIYLLVGDHDYTMGTDTPYPTIYQLIQTFIHESYVPSSSNQNFDIALVKTTLDIKWKRTIGPACLPYSFSNNPTPLTVLGWGATEFAGPSSSILKKTSLAVVTNTFCNTYYGDINAAKVCTLTQGTDACQRDSGGSLYYTSNSRQYTIGIVSYGTDCAGNSPGVNTRVNSYLGWIQQKAPTAFFCVK